jgi:hypothetical protein
MHMPPPSAQETAKAIELGHEPSTVSVKGVTWSIVVLFAVIGVCFVLIYAVYHGLLDFQARQEEPRSALTSIQMAPPEPRLQPTRLFHETTEPEDLALMRGRENLEFVQRGWIDKETGEFKIPDDVITKVAAGAGTPK